LRLNNRSYRPFSDPLPDSDNNGSPEIQEDLTGTKFLS